MKPTDTGTVDTTYTVHTNFRSPLGDDVDCTTAAGACSIVVTWGFAFVPDRHAAVASSFGESTTTTTSSTSLPPSTPRTSTPTTSSPTQTDEGTGSTGRSVLLVAGAGVLVAAAATLFILRRRRRSA